ncbi:MAG: M91 family zinc metallopeptidase [Pseudomonadota bacterium]|nr:M91 family zinc metallopeptidase [Pseudomonadota bacterium]
MLATDNALAQGWKESQEAFSTVPIAGQNQNPGSVSGPMSTESRQQLQTAAGAELDTRARFLQNGAPSSSGRASPPSMATYQRAAQGMLSRYEGQPAQQALLKNTLDGLIQQRFPNALGNQASIQQSGNTVRVTTGNADDRIHVSQSSTTGRITIDVNGQQHTYSQLQARRIDIKTAGGNDTVLVDANVRAEIIADGGAGDDTLYGGAGNDRLLGGSGNDTLIAGDGHDYVDAGAGDDTVMGGRGSDTLYGGEGHDRLSGGAGDDYIDGYLGNDTLSGGTGRDVLSGGQGDDRLGGGSGNDVIYAGSGSDQITDQSGSNNVYHQAGDKVQASGISTQLDVMAIPSNITIRGSAEFTARTQADLATLAASSAGQQMLKTIEQEGRGLFGDRLTISETADENGYYIPSRKEIQSSPSFHLGRGPEDIYGRVPPIVVLYHEMGHAQADMNGTSIPYNRVFRDNTDPTNLDHNRVPDEERRNVGLPRDHDNNPYTPAQMDSRTLYALTENGLREEMGYGKRGSYAIP